MWWIVILIPICIYVSVAILATLNLTTLSLIGITVILFFYAEVRQVRRDATKSKVPIAVMGLIVVSFIAGVVLSLLR